ncbi:hypothetical protein GGP78_003163 [Salinibacter ruber]|nr:hypothetical protein [Salinibacter ruber]
MHLTGASLVSKVGSAHGTQHVRVGKIGDMYWQLEGVRQDGERLTDSTLYEMEMDG